MMCFPEFTIILLHSSSPSSHSKSLCHTVLKLLQISLFSLLKHRSSVCCVWQLQIPYWTCTMCKLCELPLFWYSVYLYLYRLAFSSKSYFFWKSVPFIYFTYSLCKLLFTKNFLEEVFSLTWHIFVFYVGNHTCSGLPSRPPWIKSRSGLKNVPVH